MTNLKNKRVEKVLSANQVARILGVTVMTIYHYESGKRFPRKDNLRKLAQIYDCSIDELLKEVKNDQARADE